MDSHRHTQIVDSIYNAIEPHATYISRSAEDKNLYWVPPEVIEVLSWVIASLVIPIFTGVATSTISERLKQKGEEKKLIAMETQKQELEQLKREVYEALERLRQEQKPTKQATTLARASLVDVLKLNGWPTDIAESDSEDILLKIHGKLWTD